MNEDKVETQRVTMNQVPNETQHLIMNQAVSETKVIEWTASSMGTAGNFATVYEEKGKLSSVIRHFNYAYDLKSVSDEDIIKAIKLCKKTRKDFISIEINE